MREWESAALEILTSSLKPISVEKNELDWKTALSSKADKVAQHLSALANLDRGGILVFGVADDGTLIGEAQGSFREIVDRVGNIARHNLVPPIQIDHSILEYEGTNLLFINVPEAIERPVSLKGGTIYDSYIRSAGQTRKMSRQEVAQLIAKTSHGSFEEEIAKENVTLDELYVLLDIASYFRLIGTTSPESRESAIETLEKDKLVKRHHGNHESPIYGITNLGAILFAIDLTSFERLQRKAVRVVIYKHTDRLSTLKEELGLRGYASGFTELVKYVNDQLPTNEVIHQALREQVKMYPELAIRELIANALIHQDFYEQGTGPMIEIFSDRIEVTNPGRPKISTLRFIDHPPQSRNELLASIMRRMNMCEERGSGIDKVVFQMEYYQLPPPEFIETESHTKVTLFSHRPLTKMDRSDRVRACYQHSCLKFVSGQRMSNQTLRERFGISEKNYPMSSRIISDTVEAGLIKPSDPSSNSRKFATYIPFWA